MNETDRVKQNIKKLLVFWGNEPHIQGASCQKATVAHERIKSKLDTLGGIEFAIELRTTNMKAFHPPHAVWMCRHHIREAEYLANDRLNYLHASHKGEDAKLYGDRRHRLKLIRNTPRELRTRLDPAFARGDLWDPGGRFERRFLTWERGLLKALPPVKLKLKPTEAYPAAREEYLSRLPELEGLFAAMLAMFEFEE